MIVADARTCVNQNKKKKKRAKKWYRHRGVAHAWYGVALAWYGVALA